MSTLHPQSSSPQINEVGHPASPNRRPHRSSLATIDSDPFNFDFEMLVDSPDNAITDQVSLIQSHPSIAVTKPLRYSLLCPMLSLQSFHQHHLTLPIRLRVTAPLLKIRGFSGRIPSPLTLCHTVSLPQDSLRLEYSARSLMYGEYLCQMWKPQMSFPLMPKLRR